MTIRKSKSLQAYAAILGLVTCSVLIPTTTFSATDGTLGNDSTGTVDITVVKPAQARITGMTDMSIPSWVIGDGDQALFTNVCIYSTSGDYTVTASGSGTASAFTLTDGLGATALHVVPYSVAWNDAGAGALGTGGTALTATTPADFSNASVVSATCATGSPSGPNARINIAMTEANLVQLASGTLTVLVAPN